MRLKGIVGLRTVQFFGQNGELLGQNQIDVVSMTSKK